MLTEERALNAQEVADAVREFIAMTPLPDDMSLTVNENGIVATDVGGQIWWRVPVIPSPFPRYLSPLHEALAEVEGHLQDERRLDILLFAADEKPSANGTH
jgi:hypothetical protein